MISPFYRIMLSPWRYAFSRPKWFPPAFQHKNKKDPKDTDLQVDNDTAKKKLSTQKTACKNISQD